MQFLLTYVSLFLGKWKTNALYMYICIYVYIQSSEYFFYYTLLKLLNEADILFVIDFLWISIILHIITDLVFFSIVVICWPPLAIIKYAYSWNWFLPSLVSQWSAPDSVLFHFYFFWHFSKCVLALRCDGDDNGRLLHLH